MQLRTVNSTTLNSSSECLTPPKEMWIKRSTESTRLDRFRSSGRSKSWCAWRREAVKSPSSVSCHYCYDRPFGRFPSTLLLKPILASDFSSARTTSPQYRTRNITTIGATACQWRIFGCNHAMLYHHICNIFVSITARRHSLFFIVDQQWP